jgi:hypothetical protein
MPVISPSFVKGLRQSKLDYRDNLPVNMTTVIHNVKDDQAYLLTHDGLTKYADVNGVARGGVYNERFSNHFRVSGTSFERINTDGTVEVLGTVSGSSIASFANSFNTQAIVADGRMYLWDGATLTEILDPDLGVPIDITWFRGIYVMTDGESLFQTDITNEYSISPLKFVSSEFAADPIKAVARNDQNQILAFNRYSIEYFFFNPNAPADVSVLQNIPGKATKIGIVGTHCQVEMDGVFFILGGRKESEVGVYIVSGGQYQEASIREVTKIINKYTEAQLEDAVLEARVSDGNKFLYVHLPCETLIYNHTVAERASKESAWTIIKTGLENDETNDFSWRGRFGVFDPRVAKWIYGDTRENFLGELDDTIASQYGNDTECVCYTPIIPLRERSITNIEVDTIPGYSSNDLTCSFSLSFDGTIFGKEWTSTISKQGNYNTRYIVRPREYVRDMFSLKYRFVSKDKMAFSQLEITYV